MANSNKINGLTLKQEKFCQAIASGIEPSDAYRQVYNAAKMKANTVARTAYELTRKPEIVARIKEIAAPAVEKAVEEAQISRERITKEMACRAFYDPADLIKIKKPEDIATLPEPARRAICGWSYDKFGNFVLKLADKDRSLRNLGETLALFTVNNNNRNSETLDLSGVDDDTLGRMYEEASK